MARMRYVKPEFWTDSKIVKFGPWARLLYIGSWNFAMCEAGHLDDDAMALKLKVLPADPIDADEVLEEIVASGRIVRRTLPDGQTYLHIVKLGNHQKVESRYATRCPYCAAESFDEPEQTPDDPDDLSETLPSLGESSETPQDSAQEGIGGEGRGKERKSTAGGAQSRNDHASQQAAQPDPDEPEPEKPKPRSDRGTRLPPDWRPSTELVAEMRAECPNVDLRAEHKRFADHWPAQPGIKGRKSDWPATWRNWMRRAQSDATRFANSRTMPPAQGQSAWDRPVTHV